MKSEKLKVIYEDENLLVIDKPAGINSDDIPKRVHRLDKDTSGILLIAKRCRGGCRAKSLWEYGDINVVDPLCPLMKK